MKLTRGESAFATTNYIVLTLLTLVIVLPFWYVITVSITPYSEFSAKDGMVLFPTSFSFEYYAYLLKKRLANLPRLRQYDPQYGRGRAARPVPDDDRRLRACREKAAGP
ncbi:hypothetical protein [Cohnella rhizosphaerae]|uniref:Carbohydrate ABC transporter permease n=1 Tax=Cohnella rhizosphaerae TaxID=1457232 RepID=A0A9X4KSZ4_9BACL|nr:hypothetical protein [Cohnella rhizosphaerae]MDG0809993.1 hypothetical protein [Cohnella rhizosphaerae]